MGDPEHVFAVDGGGSKTAAALLDARRPMRSRAVVLGPPTSTATLARAWPRSAAPGSSCARRRASTRSGGEPDRDQRRSGRSERRPAAARVRGRFPPLRRPPPVERRLYRLSRDLRPAARCVALDRHRRRRLLAARPAARPRSAPAGAFPWRIAAAAPGSAFASRPTISTIWTVPRPSRPAASGPPPPRRSAPSATRILDWLAAARAADFAALAPAVVSAAAEADPLGLSLLDEGSRHLLRLARRPGADGRRRRSALAVAWPMSTARGSKPPCPGSSCLRPRGPTRCAAPGSSPPAPCHPNIPTSPEAWKETATVTSLMLEETRSAPARVAAMLDQDADAYAALAAELRLRDPAFVVTVARGSSDHAALFLASLAGIVAGRITASLPPSLVTRYGAELGFERAFVVSLSQSGASPDIVRTLEAARAGGAVTAAIVNQAEFAPGPRGGPLPAAACRARAQRGRDQERDRDPGRLGPADRDLGPGRGPAGRSGRACPIGSRRRCAATGRPPSPSSSRPPRSTWSAAALASASPRKPRSSSRKPRACWPRR